MLIRYFNGDKIRCEMLGVALQSLHPDDIRVHDLIGMFAVGKMTNFGGVINRIQPMLYHFDITGMPDVLDHNITFEQCCLINAQEIWEMARGRYVSLFWSGGVDSTAALVSLMMTNPHWRDQIKIYTSQYAISEEYPLFWSRYLVDTDYKILKNTEFFDPGLYTSDRVVVTGELGDLLWGDWGGAFLPDTSLNYSSPYPEFFRSNCFLNHVPLNHRGLVQDYIQRQIDQFVVPITSIADLSWMLGFTHLWDHEKLRWNAKINDTSLFDSVICFFNSIHFQSWSMCNGHMLVESDGLNYKRPAKDLIYEFTRDDDYRRFKTKQQSIFFSMDETSKRKQLSNYSLVTDVHFRHYNHSDFSLLHTLNI